MPVPGSHGAWKAARSFLGLRSTGALVGLRGNPFTLLPGSDASALSDLSWLHAGSAQGFPGVSGFHLLVSDGGQAQGRPGLQRVAGLQVRRAYSVALLQLRDAVPVIHLLGLVLASPHVEVIPSVGAPLDVLVWERRAELRVVGR